MANEIDAPCIEKSVELNANFPRVSERYFKHYYYVYKQQLARSCKSLNKSVSENANLSEETTSNVNEQCLHENRIPEGDIAEANQDATYSCKKMKYDSCSIKDPGVQSGSQECPKNDIDRKMPKNWDNYVLTGKETLVMLHTNKLCVLSLSPYHPIVSLKKTVLKVDYEVLGVNRLDNKVSGKGKRGAQVMGSKTTLCRLHTSDEIYDVPCGARGKLVQVNEALITDPDLARRSWGDRGWLGIVMPKLHQSDGLMDVLMPAETYRRLHDQQWTVTDA